MILSDLKMNMEEHRAIMRKISIKKVKTESKKLKRKTLFTKYMTELPIKQNTIFYHAYRTRIMAGNPYAIFKELMSRDEFSDFEHYWVYTDEASLSYDTFQRYANNPRVHYVKAFSDDHLKAMATWRMHWIILHYFLFMIKMISQK